MLRYLTASLLMWFALLAWGELHKHVTPSNSYDIFTKIYERDKWTNGSGPGSVPDNATPYMLVLQKFLDRSDIQSIVDLGCGDWQMMKHITLAEGKNYIGYDVVVPLIERNNKIYGSSNIKFHTISTMNELEGISADLIVVKDVLMHVPNSEVQYFVDKILPNYKYALITNDFNESVHNNKDIKFGDFRSLDLTLPPFDLKGANLLLEYYGPTRKRIYLYENNLKLAYQD